jgi:hypothetical protein
MTRDEYERRIQRLEAELRAGIKLLETAHRHQLRALHLVWAATGGEGVEIPPPVVVATAATSLAVPAPAAPILPAPPVAPPQPARRGAWDLYNHVVEALAVVPEVFNRNDICRALGYEPDRGSLYRTFLELQNDGVIDVQKRGSGKWPTRYRKTGASSAASAE